MPTAESKRPGRLGDSRAAEADQIGSPITRKSSRDAAVEQAAAWYADHRHEAERPLVPFLQRRFGLTVVEAVRVLSLAGRL